MSAPGPRKTARRRGIFHEDLAITLTRSLDDVVVEGTASPEAQRRWRRSAYPIYVDRPDPDTDDVLGLAHWTLGRATLTACIAGQEPLRVESVPTVTVSVDLTPFLPPTCDGELLFEHDGPRGRPLCWSDRCTEVYTDILESLIDGTFPPEYPKAWATPPAFRTRESGVFVLEGQADGWYEPWRYRMAELEAAVARGVAPWGADGPKWSLRRDAGGTWLELPLAATAWRAEVGHQRAPLWVSPWWAWLRIELDDDGREVELRVLASAGPVAEYEDDILTDELGDWIDTAASRGHSALSDYGTSALDEDEDGEEEDEG